jgi:hypothetical protein
VLVLQTITDLPPHCSYDKSTWPNAALALFDPYHPDNLIPTEVFTVEAETPILPKLGTLLHDDIPEKLTDIL